jgi:ubiquinone/menaquinone biosynthesis C-methylase UbiE
VSVESQRLLAQATYAEAYERQWRLNYSDAFWRFIRYRRLRMALRLLADLGGLKPGQSALVVCGGVGEEGIFLHQRGFASVTVSDISENALTICRAHSPHLKTAVLNAEDMREIPDASYDLVLVQAGLHHLPRPVQGFTEMLRVARRGVIVIEPQQSLVGNLLGTTWEVEGDAINYVFRWNRHIFEQAACSYLQRSDLKIVYRRLLDHPGAVHGLFDKLHVPAWARLTAAKVLYATVGPLNFAGNQMVGVVLKPTS